MQNKIVQILNRQAKRSLRVETKSRMPLQYLKHSRCSINDELMAVQSLELKMSLTTGKQIKSYFFVVIFKRWWEKGKMLRLEKLLPRPKLMNGLVTLKCHVSSSFKYSKRGNLGMLLHDYQILLVCIMDGGGRIKSGKIVTMFSVVLFNYMYIINFIML